MGAKGLRLFFTIGILISYILPASAEETVLDNRSPQSLQGVGEDSEKINDIQTLIKLTGGADKMAKQMMEQTVLVAKQSGLKIPDDFWKEFLTDTENDTLIKKMIPIYNKYFTHEQIREIIKFYQSPGGKKLIEVMPDVTRESWGVVGEWWQKISERVQQKLFQEGYLDDAGKIADPSKQPSQHAVPLSQSSSGK